MLEELSLVIPLLSPVKCCLLQQTRLDGCCSMILWCRHTLDLPSLFLQHTRHNSGRPHGKCWQHVQFGRPLRNEPSWCLYWDSRICRMDVVLRSFGVDTPGTCPLSSSIIFRQNSGRPHRTECWQQVQLEHPWGMNPADAYAGTW